MPPSRETTQRHDGYSRRHLEIDELIEVKGLHGMYRPGDAWGISLIKRRSLEGRHRSVVLDALVGHVVAKKVQAKFDAEVVHESERVLPMRCFDGSQRRFVEGRAHIAVGGSWSVSRLLFDGAFDRVTCVVNIVNKSIGTGDLDVALLTDSLTRLSNERHNGLVVATRPLLSIFLGDIASVITVFDDVVDRIVGRDVRFICSRLANSGHGVLPFFINSQFPTHCLKVEAWLKDTDVSSIEIQKTLQRDVFRISVLIADFRVSFGKDSPFGLERVVLPQEAKDSRLGFLSKVRKHGRVEA